MQQWRGGTRSTPTRSFSGGVSIAQRAYPRGVPGKVLSDTSVGRGISYLDRMPTEMRVMAMRDAAARDTAITHTPEFVRFGVDYRELCGV